MVLPKYVTTFTYPNGERVSYPFKTEKAAIQLLRINYAALIADEDDFETMYIAPDGTHAWLVKDNGDTTDICVSQIYVSDDYEEDRPLMSLREANTLQNMAHQYPDKADNIIKAAAADFMLTEKEAKTIVLAKKGWTTILSMLPFKSIR